MTNEEAMTLALEALEKVTTELLAVRDEIAERGGRPTTNVFHQQLWDSSFKAYTDYAIPAASAIKEALAKQEQGEPCGRLESDPEEGHVFVPCIDGDWSMLGKDLYTTPLQRKPLDCFETEKLAKQCGVEWTTHIDKLCKLAAAHGIKE